MEGPQDFKLHDFSEALRQLKTGLDGASEPITDGDAIRGLVDRIGDVRATILPVLDEGKFTSKIAARVKTRLLGHLEPLKGELEEAEKLMNTAIETIKAGTAKVTPVTLAQLAQLRKKIDDVSPFVRELLETGSTRQAIRDSAAQRAGGAAPSPKTLAMVKEMLHSVRKSLNGLIEVDSHGAVISSVLKARSSRPLETKGMPALVKAEVKALSALTVSRAKELRRLRVLLGETTNATQISMLAHEIKRVDIQQLRLGLLRDKLEAKITGHPPDAEEFPMPPDEQVRRILGNCEKNDDALFKMLSEARLLEDHLPRGHTLLRDIQGIIGSGERRLLRHDVRPLQNRDEQVKDLEKRLAAFKVSLYSRAGQLLIGERVFRVTKVTNLLNPEQITALHSLLGQLRVDLSREVATKLVLAPSSEEPGKGQITLYTKTEAGEGDQPSAVVTQEGVAVDTEVAIDLELEQYALLPETYSRATMEARIRGELAPARAYVEALGKQVGAGDSTDISTCRQKLAEIEKTALQALPSEKSLRKGMDKARTPLKTLKKAIHDAQALSITALHDLQSAMVVTRAKNTELGKNCSVDELRAAMRGSIVRRDKTVLLGIRFTGFSARKAIGLAKKELIKNLSERPPAVFQRRTDASRAAIGGTEGAAVRYSDGAFVRCCFSAGSGIRGFIKTQLSILAAGGLSATPRETISHRLPVDEGQYTSEQVPANGEFDRAMLEDTRHFAGIFGDKGGVSSGDVDVPHLKNAFYSTLKDRAGNTLLGLFRHGILGRGGADRQAQELLQLAVAAELHARDLTPEGAAALDGGLKLTLTSVSLVSPDWLEKIRHKGKTSKNESTLWAQQLQALKNLQGAKEVTIGGKTIKVDLTVLPFNFGVNEGAVHPLLQYGRGTQWKTNRETLKTLETQVNAFKEKLEAGALLGDPDRKAVLDDLDTLLTDIKDLCKDRSAYIKGDNQYEVGAKILLVTSIMEQTVAKARQTAKKQRVSLDESQIPGGIKGAFNCMSGKDRTGVMDGMVKTYAIMRQSRLSYQAVNELLATEAGRVAFAKTFIKVMAFGGGLEITEWNTGVKGYKVNKEFLPWHTDKGQQLP